MSSIKLVPIVDGKLNKSDYNFTWRMTEFSKHFPENTKQFVLIFSPIFYGGEKNGMKLKWRFYVRRPEGDEDFLHFGLYLEELDVTEAESERTIKTRTLLPPKSTPPADEEKHVRCQFDIGIGNSNDKWMIRTKDGTPCIFHLKGHSYLWEKLTTLSELYKRRNDLLENDVFQVTVEFQVYPTTLTDRHLRGPFGFSDFVNNKKFSDVKIKCGETLFYCHKIILSAKSVVFNRMFEDGKWEEGDKNLVEIDDVNDFVMEGILKFMYTGIVQLPTPTPYSWSDLIYGTEKYDLDELKDFCFQRMFEEATMDNFGTIFLTAHTFNAKLKFKEGLQLYFNEHMGQLMKNSNFKKLYFNNLRVFHQDYESVIKSDSDIQINQIDVDGKSTNISHLGVAINEISILLAASHC